MYYYRSDLVYYTFRLLALRGISSTTYLYNYILTMLVFSYSLHLNDIQQAINIDGMQ